VDSRYRLGPRLGRGGMADVFEAWDLRLERKVAIKRYRATTHGTGLRRFMAEAEMLGGLSHPALLTVFDMSFDGERPFLVLSLATGGTLRDRLDTGCLLPSRVAEIGATVAEALAYVHERGIVHRDVKPSNVLFDDQGECYLADFGIARTIGAAHLTDSNEFVGTAAYLAPEQVEDRSTGPAADVYALGLVLLECLTGEPEYTGTDVEMALARLTRAPRIPGAWGQQWRAVLTAMTAMNPEERPDAEQCVALLRALAAGQTVPLTVPRRRPAKVYGGMVTLAAAAVAAMALIAGPVRIAGDPSMGPAQIVQAPTPEPAQQRQPAETGARTPAEQPATGRVAPAESDEPGKGSTKGKGRSGGSGNGSSTGTGPGSGHGHANEAEAG
jgi:eukaryotic-like serine/threonine-protein kinase